MTIRKGIGSYEDEDASGDESNDLKQKKQKADGPPDPEMIRKNLERYRDEMVEDAPASNSAEDNA